MLATDGAKTAGLSVCGRGNDEGKSYQRNIEKKSFCRAGRKPSKISYPLTGRKAATMAAIQSQAEAVVNRKHPYGAVAAWCVVFFALVASVRAQEANVSVASQVTPRHIGVPQDWSERHVIFTRDGLARHPELIGREPRVTHQAMQRWQGPNRDALTPDALNHDALKQVDLEQAPKKRKVGPKRDWNITPFGANLDTNMFPSKFSFDPAAAPDCTNDYVVFGLPVAGVNGGQANLIGINNLYSGTAGLCGSAPTVLFAYNTTTATGGKIVTSPIISLDGTKIGFVESLGTSCIFHVLTWNASDGGGIKTAVAPTAGEMTSVTFSTTANNTSSSPWIDYTNDIVYVGSDDGVINKITGVFNGTPTLVNDTIWPVTVSTGFHLTPPVLDAQLGALMIGSANGSLYRINITTGAVSTLSVGAGTGNGIVSPPIVDVTNGTTFVVSGNDGTSGVLVEADTASMTLLSKARIGQASFSGTAIHLYEPAFSNDYFNDPTTGVVRLCGTGASDITPWQYSFGFLGRLMNTTPAFSQQLLVSTTARCTGWTEFFNPHVGTSGTDYFFFGLTQDCTSPGSGAPGGCVAETTGDVAPLTVTVDGGPSGIVIDNYSTAAEASSLYLTAQNANVAYKFTQNGLN